MATIRAFALSTIPCKSLFHLYRHLASTTLHLSGRSVTLATVPAATSPWNSILVASIHMSEYSDKHAAVYETGAAPAFRTIPLGNLPGLRITSCTASSAWSLMQFMDFGGRFIGREITYQDSCFLVKTLRLRFSSPSLQPHANAIIKQVRFKVAHHSPYHSRKPTTLVR